MKKKGLALIILMIIVFSGYTQELIIGEKAPPIEIENWIYPQIQIEDWKCKAVPEDLSGKTIVLDFWFTHCAPCVASIPYLNHLAKEFPNIVFLSVSFENQDVITGFLEKMVIYYPVGSDTSLKTIRAFGVNAYPRTFLIDNKGIIRWQGDPFRLNSDMLKSVLNPDYKQNISLNNSEVMPENAAYSFSIHKHKLGMGQATYSHIRIFDINVFNKDLEYLLKQFFGINKSRILCQDSILLKTTYDLRLEADKSLTSAQNMRGMLQYLIKQQLHIAIHDTIKDTIMNMIEIDNRLLLENNRTASIGFGTTVRYDNWEAKGATLKDVKDFLENNYHVLIDVYPDHQDRYNFIIPMSDFEKAKEVLKKDYGIKIVPEQRKVLFWEINKTE